MEFELETDSDELPLMQIMNTIAFDNTHQGKKFDANFISKYNKGRNEFEYYI